MLGDHGRIYGNDQDNEAGAVSAPSNMYPDLAPGREEVSSYDSSAGDTAASGFIGIVLGLWLSGVFAASLFGRSESEGLNTQIILASGVLWPLLYFLFSANRFIPVVPSRGVAVAIFLFALFAGASIYVSPIMWTSLAYYAMTLSAIFIALQFGASLTHEQCRRGLTIYAYIMCIILSLYAVRYYHPGVRLGNDYGTQTTIFGPNSVGLVTLSVIAASLSIRPWLLKLIVLIPMIAVLILTDSRASALGTLAAVTIILAATEKRGGFMTKFAVFMGILAGAALLVIYWNDVMDAVAGFLALDNHYRGLGSGATGRQAAWKETWDLFLSSPVIGVGFRAHDSMIKAASSAHNGYLAMLAEVGIAGFLSVLFIVVSGLRRLKRLNHITQGAPAVAVLLGICCGYCFVALFERYLLNVGNPTSLLFMLGIFYQNRNTDLESTD